MTHARQQGGRSTSTVLVTCFEPFGGASENASQEAVALLARDWADPAIDLITATLPVVYAEVDDVVATLLVQHRPDAVVAVGEDGTSGVVSVETTAANLDDAPKPDNSGEQRNLVPIDPDGPPSLPARLDAAALVADLTADGIAATTSDDAGLYLCNHVLHHLMARTDLPGGFVHVPALRSEAAGGQRPEDAVAEVTLEQCAEALAHAVRHVAARAAG